MKNIILFLLICTASIGVQGQKLNVDYTIMSGREAYVTKLEMRTLEWSRLHQLDSLATIVPFDYLGIFSSTGMKRNSRKDALSYSNDFVLRSYQVDNLVTSEIKPDVVVVTYELTQDGNDGNGVKWPGKVSATATYIKRNGKWFSRFYRESIITP